MLQADPTHTDGTTTATTTVSSTDDFPVVANLPNYVAMCHSSDSDEVVLLGVTNIRRLLSQEADPPIQEVVDAGMIATLVGCMRTGSEQLQFQASWALSNIASSEGEFTNAVVDAGTVQAWIDQLSTSQSCQVVDQAIWGIGNVMGDGAELRDMCMQWDVLPPLLTILSGPMALENPAIVRNGVWALSNVVRHPSRPSWDTVVDIVDVALKYTTSDDIETLSDAMWALKYLSDFEDGPDYLSQCGTLSRLMELADSILAKQPICRVPLQGIVTNASGHIMSRAIGKYGSSNEGDGVVMLSKIVEFTRGSLENGRGTSVQKHAMETLSTLVKNGDSALIQRLIDDDLVPVLMMMLGDHNRGNQVARLTLSVVEDMIVNGTPSQHYTMALGNLIPLLCHPLSHYQDEGMSRAVLTGIGAMLRGAEGGSGGGDGMASYLRTLMDSGFASATEAVAANSEYSRETRELASQVGQTYFKCLALLR